MTDLVVDPRRSIARLAAAVMAADARVTSAEIAAAAGLVRLGLGALEPATRDELARAVDGPIDVGAACAVLLDAYPDGGGTILAALADIAASDGELDPREVALLGRIGDALDVAPAIVAHVVRTAAAVTGASVLAEPRGEAAPRPVAAAWAETSPAAASETAGAPPAPTSDPLATAYAALGLAPGASAAVVEDAYRAVIERYQPIKVLDLGSEFAVLAVRRLAAATAAFTAIGKARGSR
ncbi:MAG: TerB family tellurite resistance protein [Deltaproteobacteria bacterium]|nr:TerB family tellurite resistance protein [Deltaproteobacteria bacterium]